MRGGAPLVRLVGRSTRMSNDTGVKKLGQAPRGDVARQEHTEQGSEPVPFFHTCHNLPADLPPLAPAADDDGSALATLVVAHGDGQLEGWTGRGVDYAALGGEHQRRLLPASPTILHGRERRKAVRRASVALTAPRWFTLMPIGKCGSSACRPTSCAGTTSDWSSTMRPATAKSNDSSPNARRR